ncbi:phosphatidylglycerophosphatase A family protein [Selenihalanaerobacter shriftii]|uniref:Phosphatidylglycerophosphatase A n=1 Tax=Selenihalanaerobacter shriftii TaxID=142842 RepID=A0A1T4JM75_9FIRM|nr:phosphatidylglycerophosphatase A [Selenihalanaerobacter shriftii]SJZ31272.1 phosphatidylglycerophosphatase A [Selenihalanaerobacter shriftii]
MHNKNLIKFLASGFYSGLSPIAPGTAGTVVAAVLAGVWLQKYTINLPLILVLTLVGIVISHWAEELYGEKDCQKIVIDEWAGYFVAMFGLGINMLIPAFILFRIFDITKPSPIRNLQEFHGGIGIMLDDILAGIMANLLIRLILAFV